MITFTPEQEEFRKTVARFPGPPESPRVVRARRLMAEAGTQRREQFERDGYLIVRGLFPPEEAASLRDYYMEIHARRAIQGYNDGLPESDILYRYPRLVHPHQRILRRSRPLLRAGGNG